MRTIVIVCVLAAGSVGLAVAIKERILRGAGARPTLAAVAAAAPSPAVADAPRAIALQADRNGHFHTEAVVEGRALRMLVDTGATVCAFSQEDAERAGIRVSPGDFTRTTATANGLVRVAPVRIASIRIGAITVRDVEAVVIPRGRLSKNLLGMSFLRRLRDFQVAGGTLTLRG